MGRCIEYRYKIKDSPCWYHLVADTGKELFNGFAKFRNVITETIGEFTGLLDRNKTKIFEGDIVKADVDFEPNGRIGWIGKIVFQNGAFCFWRKENDVYELNRYHNFEIIGNIYDNPELLELIGAQNA